jgi:hypothetical protein
MFHSGSPEISSVSHRSSMAAIRIARAPAGPADDAGPARVIEQIVRGPPSMRTLTVARGRRAGAGDDRSA